MLQWFKQQVPDEFRPETYKDVFERGLSNSHLHVLQWVKQEDPNAISMSEVNDNCCISALKSGRLDVLEWFKEHDFNKMTALIKTKYPDIFGQAFEYGHLEVLQWFKEQVPESLMDFIQNNYSNAFDWALKKGRIELLKWLEEQAPYRLEALIPQNDYRVFRSASNLGDSEILSWLLKKPSCLAYAELHQVEYARIVNSFIEETLRALYQERQGHLSLNPQEVFDINDPTRVTHCFYMIRNLIRRNDRDLDDALRFLLAIPAVRASAHQEISRGNPNELVRLALAINNIHAVELLLDIEAVMQLAEANNFYDDENRNGVDLRRLAQDRESSMNALSVAEEKRLEEARRRYQPLIQNSGINSVIDALRNELKSQYELSPARITNSHGQNITLPFEYDSFQLLKLEEVDNENALKAYYQHKAHTAWRYLAKPNPWIHPNAPYYVQGDTQHPTWRWSRFEGYEPLIAMLYLAVIDKEIAVLKDPALEGRLAHFIEELALIGRAHNWDKTQIGKNGREEEYDDLEADKPSCYSGMKKRLFQSIMSHPLFDVLTVEHIKMYLRDLIRDHFVSCITDENRDELREACENYFIDFEWNDILKQLDINKELQKKWFHELANSYGTQFSEDVQLIRYFRSQLSLHSEELCHALKYYTWAGLGELLQQKPETKQEDKKEGFDSEQVDFYIENGLIFLENEDHLIEVELESIVPVKSNSLYIPKQERNKQLELISKFEIQENNRDEESLIYKKSKNEIRSTKQTVRDFEVGTFQNKFTPQAVSSFRRGFFTEKSPEDMRTQKEADGSSHNNSSLTDKPSGNGYR